MPETFIREALFIADDRGGMRGFFFAISRRGVI